MFFWAFGFFLTEDVTGNRLGGGGGCQAGKGPGQEQKTKAGGGEQLPGNREAGGGR